jgi:hypothetical protein
MGRRYGVAQIELSMEERKGSEGRRRERRK